MGDSMTLAIQPPSTNRGSFNQDTFGLKKGLRFKQSTLNQEPKPQRESRPTHTTDYRIRSPGPENYNDTVNVGAPWFIKRNNNEIADMAPLSMLLLHFQTAYKNSKIQQSRKFGNKETGPPVKNLPASYDYLNTVESFRTHMAFVGAGYGPIEPGGGNDSLAIADFSNLTRTTRTVAVADEGHCYFPNLFGPMLALQDLFMIIKKVPAYTVTTLNPLGAMVPMQTKVDTNDMMMTTVFTTNARKIAPFGLSELSILAHLDSNKQPARDNICYIEDNEIKRGLLVYLGKNLYSEGLDSPVSRYPSAKHIIDPHSYVNRSMIEINLHPKIMDTY